MSAQEREALAEVIEAAIGQAIIDDVGYEPDYIADALLAAGWTLPGLLPVPVADEEAIERAQNVVMSAIRCYMPFGWEEGEPDGFAASIVAALGTSALLVSPVREPDAATEPASDLGVRDDAATREPGRGEAEIKAEGAREALRDFGFWLEKNIGSPAAHLRAYELADQVTDTEGTD